MKKIITVFVGVALLSSCGAEKEDTKNEDVKEKKVEKSEEEEEEVKNDDSKEKIEENYEVNVPADIKNACDCNTLFAKEQQTLLDHIDGVSEGELSANEDLQEKVIMQLQRMEAIEKQCMHLNVKKEDMQACDNYETFKKTDEQVKAKEQLLKDNIPMD